MSVFFCPPSAPISSDPAINVHSQQIRQLYDALNNLTQGSSGPSTNVFQNDVTNVTNITSGETVMVVVVVVSATADLGRYTARIVGKAITASPGGNLVGSDFANPTGSLCTLWNIAESGLNTTDHPNNALQPGEYFIGRVSGRVSEEEDAEFVVLIDPDSISSENFDTGETGPGTGFEVIHQRTKRFVANQPHLRYYPIGSDTALLDWEGVYLGYWNNTEENDIIRGLAKTIVFGDDTQYTEQDEETSCDGTIKTGQVEFFVNNFPPSSQGTITASVWTLGVKVAAFDLEAYITTITLENVVPGSSDKFSKLSWTRAVTGPDLCPKEIALQATIETNVNNLLDADTTTETTLDADITKIFGYDTTLGKWVSVTPSTIEVAKDLTWNTSTGEFELTKVTLHGFFYETDEATTDPGTYYDCEE